MKRIFLQFNASPSEGGSGSGAKSQKPETDGKGNAQTSGANDQKQGSQGETTATPASPVSGPDSAGPSATIAKGESEDQTGDGIKDAGSKNSATENTGTVTGDKPKTASGDKPKTASGDKTKTENPEKENTSEAMEQRASSARKESAKLTQPALIGGAATTSRSLSATLKHYLREDSSFEDDKHVAVAAKKLADAGDTFASAIGRESIDADKVRLGIASGLSKKQIVNVVISQTEELVTRLTANKSEAGRTGSSSDINDGLELLNEAVESLKKSVA